MPKSPPDMALQSVAVASQATLGSRTSSAVCRPSDDRTAKHIVVVKDPTPPPPPPTATDKKKRPPKSGAHDLLKHGHSVKRRWVIGDKLGEGGCGAVYEAYDLLDFKTANSDTSTTDTTTTTSNTDSSTHVHFSQIKIQCKRYALKIEKIRENKDNVIKMERKILKSLQGKRHNCQLLDCGKELQFNWIAMTLLGPSLSTLKQKMTPGRTTFTTATTVRIGIQTLQSLADLHEAGFIHRDIKPANFAVGLEEPLVFYILDFGLARQYRQKDGSIRPPRPKCLFRGTHKYCSPSAHVMPRVEQSRRDDLFSWLYTMIELAHGLPWNGVRVKEEVAKMKKTITDDRLLHGCPQEFQRVLTHVKRLDYDSTPDYRLLKRLLLNVMRRHGYQWKQPYDWQSGADKFVYSSRNEPFDDNNICAGDEPSDYI